MTPQAMLRQRILLALCALAAVAIAIALWMTLNLYGASGVGWAPSGVPTRSSTACGVHARCSSLFFLAQRAREDGRRRITGRQILG